MGTGFLGTPPIPRSLSGDLAAPPIRDEGAPSSHRPSRPTCQADEIEFWLDAAGHAPAGPEAPRRDGRRGRRTVERGGRYLLSLGTIRKYSLPVDPLQDSPSTRAPPRPDTTPSSPGPLPSSGPRAGGALQGGGAAGRATGEGGDGFGGFGCTRHGRDWRWGRRGRWGNGPGKEEISNDFSKSLN